MNDDATFDDAMDQMVSQAISANEPSHWGATNNCSQQNLQYRWDLPFPIDPNWKMYIRIFEPPIRSKRTTRTIDEIDSGYSSPRTNAYFPFSIRMDPHEGREWKEFLFEFKTWTGKMEAVISRLDPNNVTPESMVEMMTPEYEQRFRKWADSNERFQALYKVHKARFERASRLRGGPQE